MTCNETLTIIAMLAGPVLAVQAQKYIERRLEARGKKIWIFRTLMATRRSRLSHEHVVALNNIDIEFYGGNKRDQEVILRWKAYLDHLDSGPRDPKAPDFQQRVIAWDGKTEDLFIDLLFDMSKALNYDFDKVHLRRQVYSPEGHGNLEKDQEFVRQTIVEILAGKKAIPICLVEK